MVAFPTSTVLTTSSVIVRIPPFDERPGGSREGRDGFELCRRSTQDGQDSRVRPRAEPLRNVQPLVRILGDPPRVPERVRRDDLCTGIPSVDTQIRPLMDT